MHQQDTLTWPRVVASTIVVILLLASLIDIHAEHAFAQSGNELPVMTPGTPVASTFMHIVDATLTNEEMVALVAGAPVANCAPRPAVRITTTPTGDGRLSVAIVAGSGVLRSIRFERLQNAYVTMDGQSFSAPLTVTPQPTSSTTFVIARLGPQGPVTIDRIVVVDDCGEWSTFIGGGTSVAWWATVQGLIRNNVSGAPVAGATVTVQGVAQTAVTNGAGQFHLMVPPGSYAFTVSAPGYVRWTRSIGFAAGLNTNVALDLTPMGRIAGVVRNGQDGQPRSGATVRVAGTALVAMTDGNGAFTFPEVEPGARIITTSAQDFLQDTRQVTISPGAGVSLDVRIHRAGAATLPTEAGSDIRVNVGSQYSSGLYRALVRYSTVTTAGATTLNRTTTAPSGTSPLATASDLEAQAERGESRTTAACSTFLMSGSYFQVSTTANTSGQIQVSIPYDVDSLGSAQPRQQRLNQWKNGQWVDITSAVDEGDRVVKGQTDSLGTFGILADSCFPSLPVPTAISTPQPGPGVYVVFIPGIAFDCSKSLIPDFLEPCHEDNELMFTVDRGQDSLSRLSSRLGGAATGDRPFLYSGVLYYSYGEGTFTYRARDTRQSLATSAQRLTAQLRGWGTSNTYDIVTHSLGGAVAAYWAATEAGKPENQDLRRVVRSVTTLDSPVRGIDPARQWVVEVLKAGGQAGSELALSDVKTTMENAPQHVDIFTLGNSQDVLVPPDISTLPGRCPSSYVSCPMSLGNWGAHSALQEKDSSIAAIDRLLGANNKDRWRDTNATNGNCPNGQYRAEYFSNGSVSGTPSFVFCESQIDKGWGGSGPVAGIPADNFSVRWTGRVPFTGGNYSIRAESDDGIRVWINNALLIDQWSDGTKDQTVRFALGAGSYDVKVEYFERTGSARARVSWTLLQAVACPDGQFRTQYFDNNAFQGIPVFESCEASIDKDWGQTGPVAGVPADNFSVLWNGRFPFQAGTYTFRILTDDGMRVYVDNVLVVDGWRDQPATEYSGTRQLAAGLHDIRVEYYERSGGARARVTWAPSAGAVSGFVSNAGTGQALAGVSVSVANTSLSTTTGTDGRFSLSNVPAGDQSLAFSRSGYVAQSRSISVQAGVTASISVSMAPVTVGDITLVLDWGSQPRDLDAHLSGPNGAGGRFHVYFGDQDPVLWASLDTDDWDHSADPATQGPETITVRRNPSSGQYVPGEYHYWVHNYVHWQTPSEPTFTGSGAFVTLSQGGTQVASFAVSAGAGNPSLDVWTVVNFTIDTAGNMTRVVVNQFTTGGSTTVLSIDGTDSSVERREVGVEDDSEWPLAPKPDILWPLYGSS